jgi:hypothetical protein
MIRMIHLGLLLLAMGTVRSQRIDSVHIFRDAPTGLLTSASAESAAWRSQRARAQFVSIQGPELDSLNRAFAEQKPSKHKATRPLDLAYLGFAFSQGGRYAIGVLKDWSAVMNLTVRVEYPLAREADRRVAQELVDRALR